MKSIVSAIFIFALLPAGRAQQKAELRIGGGYGISAGSQYLLDNPAYGYGDPNSVSSSFGRGISFIADATWWLSRVLGVTAGGSYSMTDPDVKGQYRPNYPVTQDNIGSNFSWQGRTAFAMAGFALRIPGVKLNPYVRMGALLPVYSNLTETTSWEQWGEWIINKGTYKRTFRLRNTLGYTASAGIAPALGKHIALFAEINIQTLAILARRATLTSYVLNGVENINNYNTYYKETVYTKKADNSYNGYPSQPNQQPVFSFPFSSAGIRIGVSFKL